MKFQGRQGHSEEPALVSACAGSSKNLNDLNTLFDTDARPSEPPADPGDFDLNLDFPRAFQSIRAQS